MGKVKVFGAWVSPFAMRVKIALQMKGVEYEYVEEDLFNKSEELLNYNPIHKKVPVMLVDGKPIAESLVIMEYIDEAWSNSPILPADPYDRARARFWAKFIDDKLLPQLRVVFKSHGEECVKARKELTELLSVFENQLNGKKFFGGDDIGFLDIVASIIAIWIPCWQVVVGKELLSRVNHPRIYTWVDELLQCSVIKQNMPDQQKLEAYYQARFARMNIKVDQSE